VINHGVTKALVFLVAGDAIGRYGTRDMRLIRACWGLRRWRDALAHGRLFPGRHAAIFHLHQ